MRYRQSPSRSRLDKWIGIIGTTMILVSVFTALYMVVQVCVMLNNAGAFR